MDAASAEGPGPRTSFVRRGGFRRTLVTVESARVTASASQPGSSRSDLEAAGDVNAAAISSTDSASAVEAEVILAAIDAAPDGIVMADEDGQILFANRQVEELFGYDRDSLLGRSVDELLPEDLRKVHRAHRTRYRVEPRLRSMGAGLMLFGRRSDGTDFPVEISLSPMPSDHGLRVVAVVRDVTERLLAEAAGREVREALDVTRDAVLVLDADTLRFTYANQGATEQVGYSHAELLEMTMLHITPEFTEHQLRELLGSARPGRADLDDVHDRASPPRRHRCAGRDPHAGDRGRRRHPEALRQDRA